MAPRRAAAGAPAKISPTRRHPKIWPRGKPPKGELTENQLVLEKASPLIDLLDPDTVTAALDEFAIERERIVEWATGQAVEHARIDVPVDTLGDEDYVEYQRHVYFWCLKAFVKNGNWPPTLARPVNEIAKRQGG